MSSAVTFFSAFALYFVTVIDSIDVESITNGALVSLLFVGVRAGVKAVLELFILKTVTK
jgi:hypothetical protein